MKKLIVMFSLVSAFSSVASAQYFNEPSSFQRTCQNVRIHPSGQYLLADCRSRGVYYPTSTPIFAIHNNHGTLVNGHDCSPSSYQQSCMNFRIYGDILSAQCRSRGRYWETSIQLTGIHNDHSRLVQPSCGLY